MNEPREPVLLIWECWARHESILYPEELIADSRPPECWCGETGRIIERLFAPQ